MKQISTIIVLTIASSLSFGQSRAPQFKDFPVDKVFKGKPHEVILTREDRMFRTRLRAAAKERPNFAGHYIFTTWGCGSGCVTGAAIDAEMGRVYQLPYTICCWSGRVDDNFKPIDYRLNSKLIVFYGARNEKEGDEGTHFYKFENNRFVPIRSIKRAGQD